MIFRTKSCFHLGVMTALIFMLIKVAAFLSERPVCLRDDLEFYPSFKVGIKF